MPSVLIYLITVFALYVISCEAFARTRLPRELQLLEERLERLEREEELVLDELQHRVQAAEMLPEERDFYDVISRARRTPEAKTRVCGIKIKEALNKACPQGCSALRSPFKRKRDSNGDSVGVATKCCVSKCSMADMKEMCCPSK
ncbi:unnamed protein product [Caenorhabditis auriculariae]|uniref:Insulin-like domain-containing protein n=1 Tax=Caenorhabditis auriculariae TaxID=2777116 RepID=A0A8S1HS89_9PELO|nr:unnamed protein product [Caenorhabditis auriculariae]